MNDRLLREYVRQQLTQEHLLRTYVRAILVELSPAAAYDPAHGGYPGPALDQSATEDIPQEPSPPLRDVVERVLADNSVALGYSVENAPRTASEVYARFSSSGARDVGMDDLKTTIETEVTSAYPEAAFSFVKLSKHSREVLRIVVDRQKVTVAFKGPSVGGTGLKFEDVLFAVIKYKAGEQSGAVPNTRDYRRIKNTFFKDASQLTDEQAWKSVKEIINGDVKAEDKVIERLVGQALSSWDNIRNHPDFLADPVVDAKTSGGRGGKGDLTLVTTADKNIDLSLKAEEKAGTNNFIFNKDLGDGITIKNLGRPDISGDWSESLIKNPAGEPWWMTARKAMVKPLVADGRLRRSEANAFSKKMDGGGRANLVKVRKLIDEDSKQKKGKSYLKSSAVMRKALGVLQANFKNMATTDEGKKRIISLLEEARFGSTADRNSLYKLTSSPTGGKVKKEVSNIDALFTGDPPSITAATLKNVFLILL